jgi:hypothetical protein
MKYLPTVIAAASVLALPFISLAAEPLPTYTVSIVKYVDGHPATTATTSANGASFPMFSYWSAKNLVPAFGHGTYTLDASGFNSEGAPYTAVTSQMTAGANYNTREEISWVKTGTLVSGDCRPGAQYRLEGYSLGNTLAEAEAAGPTAMSWAGFGNIQGNKYIIVWNRHCLASPVHLSPKNGAKRTTSEQQLIDWADVSSPYGTVSYIYQSATSADHSTNPDGSFASPVYTSGPLSNSEIPTGGTPPALYYWHVKAMDSAGNTSEWSNPSKLLVTPDPIAT